MHISIEFLKNIIKLKTKPKKIGTICAVITVMKNKFKHYKPLLAYLDTDERTDGNMDGQTDEWTSWPL